MREGDLIGRRRDGKVWLSKILRIEKLPDGSEVFHCLTYAPLDQLKNVKDLENLQVVGWHAPIAGESVRKECKVVRSDGVRPGELKGYFYYLKTTNFPRYVEETGQDMDQVLEAAQQCYRRGCEAQDRQQPKDAIEAYTQALDLFPMLSEAADNRAMAWMELGEFEKAIGAFEASLQIHEDNPVAHFEIGECLLKLGRIEEAEQRFAAGAERWPDQPQFGQFLELARHVRKSPGPRLKFWKK